MNIELTPKNAETLAKNAALAAHAQKKAISSQFVMRLLLFLTFALCAVKGMAQMPNPYGPSINLKNAKKAAAPTLAEARKNNWTMAVLLIGAARRTRRILWPVCRPLSTGGPLARS